MHTYAHTLIYTHQLLITDVHRIVVTPLYCCMSSACIHTHMLSHSHTHAHAHIRPVCFQVLRMFNLCDIGPNQSTSKPRPLSIPDRPPTPSNNQQGHNEHQVCVCVCMHVCACACVHVCERAYACVQMIPVLSRFMSMDWETLAPRIHTRTAGSTCVYHLPSRIFYLMCSYLMLVKCVQKHC
jgi:hypothetical protein